MGPVPAGPASFASPDSIHNDVIHFPTLHPSQPFQRDPYGSSLYGAVGTLGGYGGYRMKGMYTLVYGGGMAWVSVGM